MTPRQIIKALKEAGFSIHHATKSHIVLKHTFDSHRRVSVFKEYRHLKTGTLRILQREAGITTGRK